MNGENLNPSLLQIVVSIFALTFFLDLLELSFKRAAWFLKTLRFWLYFILHLILAYLAAFLLHDTIPTWYLLAFISTFLAVSVISNTNVNIAGYSLVPIAELFNNLKEYYV